MVFAHTFRVSLAAIFTTAAVALASSAGATIVERVVAVVGERPLLLSELRGRAAPFLVTLSGSDSQRAQAQSKVYAEMLDRMIDEELVRRAASRAQLKVSSEEVDSAIERVAKGNGVDVDTLLAEVKRSGVSRAAYRRELRTQLLDAKVMNLRLQGRIRVSEDEMRTEYEQLVNQERRSLLVRLAVVRIGVPKDASSHRRAALAKLAKRVSMQANSGEDFAELSRQHSTDEATRAAGGLLAPLPPVELPKELRQAVLRMNMGDVSAPIMSDGVWVVLKVVDRAPSSLPPFEDVVPQLQQRVQLQKMETARRNWLDALRKTTHVEVRL
jgi:peptidyl-prolyl cis-trans isomerase SurA